jgi:exodeoxyribonuclease (lambda-induced)
VKIHSNVEQGSVDWLLLRAGKITASEMDALITPLGKVRDGDGVQTYLTQKLVERWTGGPLPQLQGIFDVEQGQILEERAKPAFTIHTGLEIQNAAFIETDDGRAGCSPDAMIGETSGVEIKCPTMPIHVGYLLAGKLPKQYVAQVQGSMWVTGCHTWHFFSYSRQLPPLHLVIGRDENFHRALAVAVEDFLKTMDAAFARLVELNGGPPKRPIITPRKEFHQNENDIPH